MLPSKHESVPVDDEDLTVMRAALEGEQQARRVTEAGGRGVMLRFGVFYSADAPSMRETVAMAQRRIIPQIGSG